MSRSTQLVEIYRDDLGEYRWRFVATNGAVLAVSSESYVARGDALRCAAVTFDFYPGDVQYDRRTRALYGYVPREMFDLEVVSRP